MVTFQRNKSFESLKVIFYNKEGLTAAQKYWKYKTTAAALLHDHPKLHKMTHS
jgi:hypothetical protein